MVEAAEEDGLLQELHWPIYIVLYEERIQFYAEDEAQPEEVLFIGSSGGGP